MEQFINRNKAIKHLTQLMGKPNMSLKWLSGVSDSINAIKAIAPETPANTKAYWIVHEDVYERWKTFECSNCTATYDYELAGDQDTGGCIFHYCPCCGASTD